MCHPVTNRLLSSISRRHTVQKGSLCRLFDRHDLCGWHAILRTILGEHEPCTSSQEKRRVRSQHISRDHRRWPEDSVRGKETNNIRARGRGRCNLLCSKRQGAAHRRIQDRQGSDDRYCERGELLWGRFVGRPAPAYGLRCCHDGLRDSPGGKEDDDGSTSSRTHSFPGQFLHEPLQETRLHSLCRRDRRCSPGPQLSAQCRSARLSASTKAPFSEWARLAPTGSHANGNPTISTCTSPIVFGSSRCLFCL